MAEQINIPSHHQQFCREVAKLCRKHGLMSFGGQFKPGYQDSWSGEISFRWESGRHEEDVGKVSIWSQMQVNTKIDDREPTIDESRSQMIGRTP